MIKHKLSLFALAVLAGVVMSATNASAASYSAGNLLLGFRNGGSENYSYYVNIGAASLYEGATPGSTFNLSIGSLGTELTAAFGSSWSTRTDLFWGVVGAVQVDTAPDPAHTIYLSSATATAGHSTVINNSTDGLQGGWYSKIATTGTLYKNTNSGAAANTTALGLTKPTIGLYQANSVTSSWGASTGGNNAYAAPSSFTTGAAIEAVVGGVANQLDLYQLVASDAASAGASGFSASGSHDLGTFSINSSGTVSFAAVPEPSTWALMGLGFGVVVLAVRRRQLRA